MKKLSLFLMVGQLVAVGLVIGLVVRQGAKNELAGTSFDQGRFTLLKEAVQAPNFTLADIDGNSVTLRSLLGKNVVLFFAEGLTCYPCLEQMVALSTDQRLNSSETATFSVVSDSPEDWRKALEYLSFLPGVKALFDEERKVFQVYAALNLSPAMQRGHHPHTFFLIGKDGVIRYVFDDSYMGIRNDMLVTEIEASLK